MNLPTLEYFFNIYIPLILSLSVHEWAHARMALFLGDDTAKHLGRITLNPFAHIDPVGTVLLPLLGIPFGWAKPVPFDPIRFKRGVSMRTGGALVALAGPVSNMILCMIIYVGVSSVENTTEFEFSSSTLCEILVLFLRINIILALFNLIPIPPLDGSHILNLFIPLGFRPYWQAFLAKGQILLIVVFFMFGSVINEFVNLILKSLGIN